MTVFRRDPPNAGTETTLVVQETEAFGTELLPGFDLWRTSWLLPTSRNDVGSFP